MQLPPPPAPVRDHYAYAAERPEGGRTEDVVLRCGLCGHEGHTALLTSRSARQVVVGLRDERQSWDRPGMLAFYDAHGCWPTQEVQRCVVCGDLVKHPERGKARHVHDDENRVPHEPVLADDQNGRAV
ncbi:hypothetical protein J2X60_000965 [Curtobacterium sp. 320]|uniref:hypothetical protein n=1 Tax=Curtobacterium sp. 320 TaxID=2817749 RepID=UPI002866032F|nr:hypothetical protein [Curtobacterium sp. 320]MDR6572329.1 hypothetical protein [Curtobacterium sp. 320]